MRRKAVCAIGAACAMVASVLLTLVVPAEAQPYPPGPCVSPSAGAAGSVGVGGTLNVALTPGCAWTPGAALSVSVNGTNIPGKTANAAGSANVSITVVSTTQLSVDDPVAAPGRCGPNTVSASGPSRVAAGGTAVHNVTFTVLCPGVTPSAVTKTSRVALTGANLARWSAIGLGLIIIGAVFVTADRRKARARD
ncbi:MAG: hypothetical protein M3179_01835 [Actinomycetota bacterium]|nr:hypothetical protein [Actinomycetota bacterium]